MTLVAGIQCRDGFVIAADTEMTLWPISFQGNKLDDYMRHDKYCLVRTGYAGTDNYGRMTVQRIKEAVEQLPEPTFAAVRGAVEQVVLDVHQDRIFKERAAGNQEVGVKLIIGIGAADRFGLLKTEELSVSEVNHFAFAGDGEFLGQHLAEKIFPRWQLPVSVTEHLVFQLFREVKERGAGVGGFTDLIALRCDLRDERFFKPSNQGFLSELEADLMEAVRAALDTTNAPWAWQKNVNSIRRTLKKLHADSQRERFDEATEHHDRRP